MKHFYTLFLLWLSVLTAQAQLSKKGIDWPSYMLRQRLNWDSISRDYATGMMLGNGRLVVNIYQADDKAIRFDIARPGLNDQVLPLGHMLLKTAGKITGAKIQLSIYDARGGGTIHTTKGSIRFSAFVPAGKQVIYASAAGMQLEKSISWEFVPERAKVAGTKKRQGLYGIWHQPLQDKSGYATVWRSTLGAKGNTLLISSGLDSNGKEDEMLQGINGIKRFNPNNLAAEFGAHLNLWHNFYQQSFISVPDQRVESCYWLQLYNQKSRLPRSFSDPALTPESATELSYLSGLRTALQSLGQVDDEERRDTIRASLERWLSQRGSLDSYMIPIVASIYANMGEGNKSYGYLNELFDKHIQSTMQFEEPFCGIDTILSAADVIKEMMIQNSREKIRIFPAVPDQWLDLGFDKLRTENGFLVSARREAGKTSYIKIYSINGGPCRIESDMQVNRVSSDKTDSPALTMSQHEGKTSVLVQTQPGESLWLSGLEPNPGSVAVVKPAIYKDWTWGLKKR